MNQEYNQNQESVNEIQLENNLKDLLERILLKAEKFVDTKEDLNQIEEELKDYENLSHLIGIIKAVFTNLMDKLEKKLYKLEKQIDPKISETFSIRTEEEYEKLEQTMIKYEVEIRNHIRIEQQLKLYAESIQTKLDESEVNRAELLNTTKQLISNLKRENQTYYEVEQKLKNEIIGLKQTINGLEKENRRKSLDLSQRDQLNPYCKINKQPLTQNQKNENSFSEYKVNMKQQQQYMKTDYNEIPIKSQQSLKQNYYNILQRSDLMKITQQKELIRNYGQKLKSKNNSLSNTQDVIQNISVQDRKRGLVSQTVSKNSSQDNSQIIRVKECRDLSRSKSSRRTNIGQKIIIAESQIKITC